MIKAIKYANRTFTMDSSKPFYLEPVFLKQVGMDNTIKVKQWVSSADPVSFDLKVPVNTEEQLNALTEFLSDFLLDNSRDVFYIYSYAQYLTQQDNKQENKEEEN